MKIPRACKVEGCEKPAKTRGWCGMHYMRWYTNGTLAVRQVKTVCTVEECGKPHRSLGYCGMHYARVRAYGTTDLPTEADRFWSKVDKSGECWLWTSGLTSSGYGKFSVGGRGSGKTVQAHRWAYEALVGPIPEGLHLDHLCRVRRCVRPTHLEPVTPKVNNARSTSPSAKNAEKQFCPKGHPLAGDNLSVNPRNGARSCRTCRREAARRWKAKNRDRVQEYMKTWRKARE